MTVGSGGTTQTSKESKNIIWIDGGSGTVTASNLGGANRVDSTIYSKPCLMNPGTASYQSAYGYEGYNNRYAVTLRTFGRVSNQNCYAYSLASAINFSFGNNLTPGDTYDIKIILGFGTTSGKYSTLQEQFGSVFIVDSSGNLSLTLPIGTVIYLSVEASPYNSVYGIIDYRAGRIPLFN